MSENIEQFDLSRLAKRLVSEDGLKDENCAFAAIEEYKKFFFLLADSDDDENEGLPGVYLPSPIVELVWQRHMLDTLNYFKDCAKYGMPNGYCHRHELRRPCSVDDSSEVSSLSSNELKREDASRNVSQFSVDCSVQQHYSFTLQAYKKMYDTPPPADIWPLLYDYGAILEKRKGVHLGANEKYLSYAIPHADVLVSVSPASISPVKANYSLPQESELMDELMWVGELVFDTLPMKQLKCGKGEPLNQISFNGDNVNSVVERAVGVKKVVKEYARFLLLLLRQKISETDHVRGSGETAEITPSKLVDELWHAHILCSPAYFEFW